MREEDDWSSKRLKEIMSLGSLQATKMRDVALKTKDVIKLTSGEPNFVTPSHIREAAKKALDEGNTFYTPTSGIPEFREAIADKIEEDFGVQVDPESEVMATPGAIEGIFLAIMCTVNPGEEVLIPEPGYVGYAPCVKFAGGNPISVPLDEERGFELKPSEIEDRITEKTKMIILNSPSNPTGMVIDLKNLKVIAEIAKKHDLLVLSDEAYEKMVYDDARHYSIFALPEMRNRTIMVGSFSKTYAMTGWRIGYLVAEKSLVQNMLKIQGSIVLCTNGVVQKAAVAALKGPQDSIAAMVKEFDKRRHFIVDGLNSIDGFSCQLPKGAFFVFPNITEFGLDSAKMTQFLIEEAKVAVYPGIAYGNLGEGHIRLTYAASIKDIETALQRIEVSVKKLR
ncbi:MAG: pyridoxal phosphate-dependent aminotransferase [Candidatus Bathyarchaeia archaeon]|jgi:aminotransferase